MVDEERKGRILLGRAVGKGEGFRVWVGLLCVGGASNGAPTHYISSCRLLLGGRWGPQWCTHPLHLLMQAAAGRQVGATVEPLGYTF